MSFKEKSEVKEIPLVSVLIVVYNAEAFLEATITSCLNQTYSNFEILILDNASTDGTIKCIKKFSDSRIRLFFSETNLGPYKGLNLLLSKARGQFIAIQDHDDLWLPEKIKIQVKFLNENKNYIGCGTQSFFFFEKKKLLILPDEGGDSDFVSHPSLMFRNANFRYFEKCQLPDEYFERIILRNKGKLFCIPCPLTVHRMREDMNNLSLVRTRWNFFAAWEHFKYSHFKDLLSLTTFFILPITPEVIEWWIRKHVTMRKAEWLTKKQFEEKYNYSL